MKRFHIHIAVADLENSIEFYSELFGQQPTKVQDDYAKWMVEDPRINFSISSRGYAVGVNHLGFQVDTPEELKEIKKLAEKASEGEVLEQGEVSCCYAKSDKHWTIDPQGLAWEHFHTMSDIEEFGEDIISEEGACCIPLHNSKQNTSAGSPCCVSTTPSTGGACCG